MNKPPQIPIETWQFFQACKTYLGVNVIQQLYKVSLRQIDRWCSDPDYTDSNQKNPLDRLGTLLSRLMAMGYVDIARAAVRRMVMIVGCEMIDAYDVVADKATLPEECLDDYGTVRIFHQSMLDGEDPLIVQQRKEEMFREANETAELYLRNRKGGK